MEASFGLTLSTCLAVYTSVLHVYCNFAHRRDWRIGRASELASQGAGDHKLVGAVGGKPSYRKSQAVVRHQADRLNKIDLRQSSELMRYSTDSAQGNPLSCGAASPCDDKNTKDCYANDSGPGHRNVGELLIDLVESSCAESCNGSTSCGHQRACF